MHFIHQNVFKWREIFSIVQIADEATMIFPNDTLLKASKNTYKNYHNKIRKSFEIDSSILDEPKI